jgi:hypothetical protein
MTETLKQARARILGTKDFHAERPFQEGRRR